QQQSSVHGDDDKIEKDFSLRREQGRKGGLPGGEAFDIRGDEPLQKPAGLLSFKGEDGAGGKLGDGQHAGAFRRSRTLSQGGLPQSSQGSRTLSWQKYSISF